MTQRTEKLHQSDQLHKVLDRGIVAILRSSTSQQLLEVARALYAGGIDVIEVTFTTPGALDVLSAIKQDLGPQVLLGAGSVLDPESARAAILAGAEFLVAPTVNIDVIRLANRYGKLMIPGAFTPTEIVTALEAGAEIVKLFPAEVTGPEYLKAVLAPLPQVRLLPTGGINQRNLASYIQAGACAVGLGSSLVSPRSVASKDYDEITLTASSYVRLLHQARAELVLHREG